MAHTRRVPPPPGGHGIMDRVPVGLGGDVGEGENPEDDYSEFNAWGDDFEDQDNYDFDHGDDEEEPDHHHQPHHGHHGAPTRAVPPPPGQGQHDMARRAVPPPPGGGMQEDDPPRPPAPRGRAPPPVPGGNSAPVPARPPNRGVPAPPPQEPEEEYEAMMDGEEETPPPVQRNTPAYPGPKVGGRGPMAPPTRSVPQPQPVAPPVLPPGRPGQHMSNGSYADEEETYEDPQNEPEETYCDADLADDPGEFYMEPKDEGYPPQPPSVPGRAGRAPPPVPQQQDSDNDEDYMTPEEENIRRGQPLPPRGSAQLPPPPAMRTPQRSSYDDDPQDTYEDPDDMSKPEPSRPMMSPPGGPPPTRKAAPPPSRSVPEPDLEVYEDIPHEDEPPSQPTGRALPQPPGRSAPAPNLPVPPAPNRNPVPQPPGHSESGPPTRKAFNQDSNNNQAPDRGKPRLPSNSSSQGPKMVDTMAIRGKKDALRTVNKDTFTSPSSEKSSDPEPEVDFANLTMKERIAMMSKGGAPSTPKPKPPPAKISMPTKTPPARQPEPSRPLPTVPSPAEPPKRSVPPPKRSSDPARTSSESEGSGSGVFGRQNHNDARPQEVQPDVEGYRWYHGPIDRKETETLLSRNGMFLVRDSTKKEPKSPYTLCVFYNRRMWNLKIRMRSEIKKFALGTYHENEETFRSVAQLIQYHRGVPITLAGPDGGQMKLTDSPDCEQDIYDETTMGF